MASNQESKFHDLSLDLADGIKIGGIYYNPPHSKTSPPFRPLMITIHGGTCSAHNFDVSPTNTASLTADNLSIPVVSINRPGYLNSTPIPIPDGSTYHKELAKLYHEQLFPDLWVQFGERQKCTSIVVLAHSIGVSSMIIAAGLYADDPSPRYPLSGLIFSGWGCRLAPTVRPALSPDASDAEKFEWKKSVMCGDGPSLDCVDPEILSCIPLQDQFMPEYDYKELVPPGDWPNYWPQYANQINVPIMFGIGEHDVMWQGNLEHIKEYETMFPKCPRFDGSLVLGAPHAIEWSRVAQGWYARCFGFAQEVSTWYGIKSQSKA